jgi:hypothetical protein
MMIDLADGETADFQKIAAGKAVTKTAAGLALDRKHN